MAEQYIVSARKYRPDSFETLIGQDNIARTLKNSIVRGQLAHAYLFCGPRGVGKTSMARIFAKTINCLNPTAETEPCGECESCRSFNEGRSYCIHELDAASNNGVEDIKALLEQVMIPPQTGRYSVYIIDEVHMLSQSAFNAFLKTLEEPPAHAIFILATTEKHKIIPTILSRCQTYDFNRISIGDIVGNLRNIAKKEGVRVDEESLHVIADKADGAMRDALTIFDQTVAFCGNEIHYEDVIRNLNVLDYEYSFRLVDCFLKGDYAGPLLTFDEILSKGFNSLYFVTALSSHFRDLLVCRTGGLDSLLDLPESLKARYKEQADRCDVKFIYDALGITTGCEAGYKASANQRLHIEYALMRIAFLMRPDSGVRPSAPAPAQKVAQAPSPVKKDAPAVESAPKTVPAVESAPEVSPKPASAPASEQKDTPVRESVPARKEENTPEPEAPAPEPSPKSPKKRAGKSSGLSLSAMIAEVTDGSKEAEPAGKDPLPEDDYIRSNWKVLADKNSDRPRLASALENSELEIEERDGCKWVTFTVLNDAQRQWIKNTLLSRLEASFRTILGTSRVRLDVAVSRVLDSEEEKKLYMPAEKAEDLMKNNPEVAGLVSDLGLDIK
ncbi:MAG: DNA polymerase III subunit gamma/tau [Bacteroidales bacterium]|nr:DNA polymerase III subunit gamma/tau [Bacteroidales bacterium]